MAPWEGSERGKFLSYLPDTAMHACTLLPVITLGKGDSHQKGTCFLQ